MTEKYKIIHKPGINKFMIRLEPGKFAYLEYKMEDNKFYIVSTYTHPDYRGRGIAHILTEKAIEFAREHGLKIVPICSYAIRFFKKHHQYRDMLDPVEGLEALKEKDPGKN